MLPKNIKKEPKATPRVLFIWGATMSGKSYLANQFDNPLVLNTDGNADTLAYPNIQIKFSDTKPIAQTLDEIISELRNTNHSYKTIVVDVIDDVIDLIQFQIIKKMNVDSLADIPFGKGYSMQSDLVKQLILNLKSLDMNVIFISRQKEYEENKVKYSLSDKFYNLVNGNADMVIQTEKIGNEYRQNIKATRKNYKLSEIEDQQTIKALWNVNGLFSKDEKDSYVSNIKNKNTVGNK